MCVYFYAFQRATFSPNRILVDLIIQIVSGGQNELRRSR